MIVRPSPGASQSNKSFVWEGESGHFQGELKDPEIRIGLVYESSDVNKRSSVLDLHQSTVYRGGRGKIGLGHFIYNNRVEYVFFIPESF